MRKDEKILEKGYNTKFYKELVGNRESAEILVPIILEIVGRDRIKKVVDLGCGTGHWLAVFKEHGCDVRGYDGDHVKESQLEIPINSFRVQDLKKEIKNVDKKYDLAMSLEVAEHLEEEYADTIVQSLVNLSDLIFFSAAIPFQRGVHHVNCQWQSYWIKKFNKCGYVELDCLRPRVWENPNVQRYYAQNAFIFVKKDSSVYADLIELAMYNKEEYYNIVHPGMWEDLHNAKFMRFALWLYKKKGIYAIYDKLFNRK